MRNSGPFFLFFCGLLSLSVWTRAHAEVECSSEVFYTWTKHAAETEEPGGVQGQTTVPPSGGAGAPPTSAEQVTTPAAGGTPGPGVGLGASAGVPQAQTVRFLLVQRKARDEAAAKNALQVEVQRQKTRAAERCKRAHESTGDCLTTKLSIKSSTLNSLSFSARAQAEKAIFEECQLQQGRCLSVEAVPATCRDLTPAAPAVEASGTKGKEPGPAKSDAKGKEAAGKAAPKKK
jgi:hypothetical protein